MSSEGYRETSYSYEEWDEFGEEMWHLNAEELEFNVNFVDKKILSTEKRNRVGKRQEENRKYCILDVVHDWMVFLKDEHGISVKPLKLNRTLHETKQMEEFIKQISEHKISPDGPDIRDVRGENPIKWYHNSLFIIYLDHYLLSTSYDEGCELPFEKIIEFLKFCYIKYLSQSSYWIDGLTDKIESMLISELTTVQICQNTLGLFDLTLEV